MLDGWKAKRERNPTRREPMSFPLGCRSRSSLHWPLPYLGGARRHRYTWTMDVEWDRVEHVFVDLDGVLVDFIGAVDVLFGVSRPPMNTRAELSTRYGVMPEEFWGRIDAAGPRFWEHMEPYPWVNAMMASLLRRFPDRCTILTSPTWHGSSAHGKIAWMNRVLAPLAGKRVFRDYVITPQKHLLAKDGAWLIDDHQSMVDGFVGCGGQATLFPQPWNTTGYRKNMQSEVVRRIIESR